MFTPLAHKSIVEAIRGQIMSLLLDRRLLPGDRLPPEKEMSQQFNVSRPALREALRTLVGEGLLETRRGQGTFVREPSTGTVIQSELANLLLMSEDLREIQDVRRIIEPVIASRAAVNATEDDLTELKDILREMEEVDRSGGSIFDLAWDFHHRLSQAAGNSAMTTIVAILYEMIRAAERPLYDRHFDTSVDIRNHRRLLEVIAQRDPEQEGITRVDHFGEVDEASSSAIEEEQRSADSGSVASQT